METMTTPIPTRGTRSLPVGAVPVLRRMHDAAVHVASDGDRRDADGQLLRAR